MASATYAVRRNQNLSRNTTTMALGPVSVGVVTIAIISALALLYLTQITKTSVYGYRLSELSQKHDKLMQVQEELEVESARLKSIETIQTSPNVAKMVGEQNISYAK